MLLIVRELGYENMTLPEFAEMVRSDENNFYNSSEALLQVGKGTACYAMECHSKVYYVMPIHIF